MKDYNYLEVEVSEVQLIWIWVILFFYNLSISYYIIVNEHHLAGIFPLVLNLLVNLSI